MSFGDFIERPTTVDPMPKLASRQAALHEGDCF